MKINKKKIFIASIPAYAVSLAAIVSAELAGNIQSDGYNTLDQILNVIIPLACVGFFCMLLYKAFKEQINGALSWIKSQFESKDSRESTPNYRRNYMVPGDIRYQ